MTENKHTPWALDGNEKSWSLLDRQGRRIALIDKGGLDAATNARLIASSPDMLAVIQLAEEALTAVGGWDDSMLLSELRTVLAKAEGSQP